MKRYSIFLFTVALTKSTKEVSGYLGESVTLLSGADPSWNISKITWSILPNVTWIATLRNDKTNVNRFWHHAGRLDLDISSGNCNKTIPLAVGVEELDVLTFFSMSFFFVYQVTW